MLENIKIIEKLFQNSLKHDYGSILKTRIKGIHNTKKNLVVDDVYVIF